MLPWYRQFWPWFLFGLPGCVVVAGLTTWWIAARHADHLVVDDYYKNGLAINQELRKLDLARALQVTAQLEINAQSVVVTLGGDSEPPALQLHLSHPVNADADLPVKLARVSPGNYQGELPRTLQHRWHWNLEPLGTGGATPWRVNGEISIITDNAP